MAPRPATAMFGFIVITSAISELELKLLLGIFVSGVVGPEEGRGGDKLKVSDPAPFELVGELVVVVAVVFVVEAVVVESSADIGADGRTDALIVLRSWGGDVVCLIFLLSPWSLFQLSKAQSGRSLNFRFRSFGSS